MIHYGLFFASLKRRSRKDFLGGKLFFDKNFQFLSKKQLPSDRFSPSTLFERSDERIPRHQAKGRRNSA